MDTSGVGFLLMLKECSTRSKILEKYASSVKNNYENYIADHDVFGMTVEDKLFGKEPHRNFYIIWDASLDGKNRTALLRAVKSKRDEIYRDIQRGTKHTRAELDRMSQWFDLCYKEEGSLKIKCSNRNKTTGTRDVPAYVITSVKDNHTCINQDLGNCGFYILVSSDKMKTTEALSAYKKRDCVEKVFRALKSSLGMDKIGVHDDDSIIGKTLIWFVASIYHSVFFNYLEPLRFKDKKSYTVPAAVDLLEAISADKNLASGNYEQRYTFTYKQKNVLSQCKIKQESILNIIGGLA